MHKKGYGKKLITKLIADDKYIKEDVDRLVAIIDLKNVSSLALFNSIGKFNVKRVKDYVQIIGDYKKIKEDLIEGSLE